MTTTDRGNIRGLPFLRGFLGGIIPIFLIISSVFLILITAKVWIPIEYRMPGFPVDSYGFSTEDRIAWSAVDINFLLGNHGIGYFDNYPLDDGSPMHNSRELQHMEDVVRVLDSARWLWWALLLVILGGCVIIGRKGDPDLVLLTVRRGGLWLVLIIGILAVLIVTAFEFLFVNFHEIFFDPGTWTFPYSDTFIRLYPERFWRDTFALVAGVSVILGGLTYLIPHWLLKRRTN